ncbi:CSN-associated deubiquitinating enzyme Ubp12 [Neopestalotiopsis sp. 37M]|nr:CSN-associated deubiquitinating enzyme Ubp12 [Neopestalotiopsis sp. 37M]
MARGTALACKLVAKTSSSKKRKIRRSSREEAIDSPSPDTPLQSCEIDDNPNFSFTSATFAPSPRGDSVPPASSLPPHLLPEYAQSVASSTAGDSPPALNSARGSSPLVIKPSYHRTIMGGAAEFPERASSPLKRRASSMEPETVEEGVPNEDVDMVTVPPAEPSAPADAVAAEDATNTQGQNLSQPPQSIEAHVKSIRTFVEEFESRPLEDGEQVYVVSRKWVESVIGDSKDSKKSAAPDPTTISPVDNSDIIWEIIEDPTVGSNVDTLKKRFIRLRPDIGPEQYNIFPPTAWTLVMQWPGLAEGQFPIVRHAHATSDNEFDQNVQLEMHPPVFTIYRLWSAHSPIAIKQIIKSSHPPPPRLARSRTFKWSTFLKQCKHLTDIELKSKVRVWRVPRQLPASGPSASSALTPPSSPPAGESGSPQDSWPNMLIDVNTFTALEDPAEREKVDFRDVTIDDNYNGHTDLARLALSTDQAIVLDEQITGTTFVSTFTVSQASEKLPAPRANSANVALNRTARSGRTSPVPSGPVTRGRTHKSGRTIGCTGLGNLGNTCYMNSALQCVRSVEELTKYVLSGEWEDEVNRENVLAHNGDVALAYALLLKEIYKEPPPPSITPRHFKSTLGRYAPAFSGYGQQDSQEFVGFLLDGLQEDLSRVKKKPYIEKPDSTDEMINDPKAIAKMAEEVWDITKRRDDSVIADLFTGLYKSTLVCPDPSCAKVSITFDPFNSLSLPLPIQNKWSHTVKFFPLNDRPVDIRVELDKSSSIKQLKDFISSRTGVPAERLHGAEHWKNKFYKQYPNGACASEEITTNDDAWIFELEATPTNWNSAESRKLENGKARRSLLEEAEEPSDEVYQAMLVPVMHRIAADKQYGTSRPMCLAPYFIVVNPEESRSEDAIRRKILQKVATLSKHQFFARDDTNSPESAEFVNSASDLSSNEGKIVAQSVQGEDDMVDITMRDAGDAKAAQSDEAKQTAKVHHFNQTSPSWMDSKEFLPGELQNMFELSYITESGSLLATGNNSVNESSDYPRLSSRIPEPPASDDGGDSGTNGTISNDEESEDESSQQTAPTRMAEESEEEDPAPVVKIPHRPKNSKMNSRLPGGAKKLKPKKYGKKGGKRAQRQAAQLARKQQAQQEREEATFHVETVDSGADGGPLIRLREAIIVDWTEGAYNALFEEKLWVSCETLPDPELDKAQQSRARRRKNGITLEDCLDEFEREEVLSEHDTWYCPRCKQHQRASKKFDLWKTPDILVVHLKRFSSSGYRREKLDVLVDFPIEGLDLTRRVSEPESGKTEIYDLIGVDCHWGGLGGGHYTAYAKNFVDGQWYNYNDSSVNRANPDKIVDVTAYLLFYRRRSDSPLGGPRFKEIIEAFDNSGSDDDAADSGEGRRLDEGSSPTGSSSAFQEQGLGATRQRKQGDHGGRTNGSAAFETKSDDGTMHLTDATFDDGNQPLRQSIEDDEGIGMTENPKHTSANAYQQTWDFTLLTSNNLADGATGHASPVGSVAASDEAQHDSSGDSVFSHAGDLDHDTDMENVPGASHIELVTGAGPEPPAYSQEPPPPDYRAEISREDMSQFWNARQDIHEVVAKGDDQRSEDAIEIRVEEEEDKDKQG